MKTPTALLVFILPYTTFALYDESSTRKINLEDIEDDHIKNERQSKSLPPPLSKQPAKGQPMQLYPPISNADYTIPNLYDTHRYSTRAHQHVQPLTDQPTAPEADYQQSPAYQHDETIVYLAPNEHEHGQPPPPPPALPSAPLHLQENVLQQQQQLYEVGQQQHQHQHQHQQQPAPHFYYSHDVPQQQQPTGNGNEYQIQFVPIDQHGGSDEQQQQHSYNGPPQVTVPPTAVPAEAVSYSHDMAYDEGPQPEVQQQQQQEHQYERAQYPIGNEIREPNYVQHVYGLPADVLFQSQKDIEYAKPADNYGPPPLQYFKKEEYSQRDYSQDTTSPKPTPSYEPQVRYSDLIKSIEYQSQPAQPDSSASNSQTSYRQKPKTSKEPALSYGYESQPSQSSTIPSETQAYYLNHQKGFKYNKKTDGDKNPTISEGYESYPAPSAPSATQTSYLNHLKEMKSVHHAERAQKPAITYGPPDTVGKEPQIEYGVPDAPFRRPVAQSNQDVYAPRRPSSLGRSNEKPFTVSFPYPPSFVSITTERSPSGKSTLTVEPSSNNEVNPWRPLHVVPSRSQGNHYRSFGSESGGHPPLVDFFHTRRAKSLLDSYIPSWLVARMQEEHARHGQQDHGQQQKQQSYSIPSPEAEDGYNTISYSSQYENIYGNHFKRSVQKKKGHPEKKAKSSDEEMTAME